MQMQLCSVFFTFSLGTRTHYFGRTILHGGAKVIHISMFKYPTKMFMARLICFVDPLNSTMQLAEALLYAT
jgi:hypothetical protein